MIRFRAVVVAAIVIGTGMAAAAQTQPAPSVPAPLSPDASGPSAPGPIPASDAAARCRETPDLAARVAACTTLIQSGRGARGESIAAYASRGDAFLQQGNVDRAIQDYGELLALAPDDADGLTKRCYAQSLRGRPKEALVDCNRALNVRPGDAAALEDRGFAYFRLDFLDAAIGDYDAALHANPRAASALYGRGIARRMRGDIVGGDADVAAARRLQADIGEVMAARGVGP